MAVHRLQSTRETPNCAKHQLQLFPFLGAATSNPESPVVGVGFELLIFAYSMVAMMLQHLHLYRYCLISKEFCLYPLLLH